MISEVISTAVEYLSQKVIKDAYNKLKTKLQEKDSSDSQVTNAVEQLEKNPNSEKQKQILQQEVEATNINNDSEIIELVKNLREQIDSQKSVGKYQIQFQDEVKGSQVGENNKQENTFQ